jgi:hypothetical protein
LAGLFATLLFGVVLNFATRDGIIIIESPDGQIASDVKVIVSANGEELAVLQADNHWSLKLANGRYTLQLQGGMDQFELAQSEATVSRLGHTILTLRMKKTEPTAIAKADNVAPTTSDSPKAESKPVPSSNSAPIALIRIDGTSRQFESIREALDLHRLGDVIELRTSEKISLHMRYQPLGAVVIRSAKGHRPLIVFKEFPQGGIGQDLIIEGCDLDLRKPPGSFPPVNRVEISGCRIWGFLKEISGVRVTVRDSILVLLDGFTTGTFGTPSSSFQLDNCAIYNHASLLNPQTGSHTLKLRNCTYLAENNERPTLVNFGNSPAHVDIEATGCTFHCRSQSAGIIDFDDMSNVTWRGDNNCYTGGFYEVYERAAESGRWQLKEQGFDAWLQRMQSTEPHSYEAKDLRFVWNSMEYANYPNALQQIEQAVRRLTPQPQQPNFGPDWPLVGSGIAYARAIKGKSEVDLGSLRKPGLPDGRIILIRDGQSVRGYQTLQEAADTAVNNDVIEIRTDGQISGCQLKGTGRLLTIRAGVGFEPKITAGTFGNQGSDRLILEGIRFDSDIAASGGFSPPHWNGTDANSPQFPNAGGIVRMTNCSVNGWVLGWFVPAEGTSTQIVNCAIRFPGVGLKAGTELSVRNSVFHWLIVNNEFADSETSQATVDRCVLWQPLPRQLPNVGCIDSGTPLALRVSNTFLMSHRSVLSRNRNHLPTVTWNGSGNVYCKPNEFGFGQQLTYTLENIRQQNIAEPDSIELPPFEFDPTVWQVDAENSPNYHQRADGTDYGVDVDRLIKAFMLH